MRKEFFVARLYNLPAQLLACEESKIRSKKIRQLSLEGYPVPSKGIRYLLCIRPCGFIFDNKIADGAGGRLAQQFRTFASID